MRMVRPAMAIRASQSAAWQRFSAAWRRLRHSPDVRQLSATVTATSGASARLTVTHPDDTAVTIELRRRIEGLEIEQDRMRAALAGHDRRLDDAQRSHAELAAGGVYVQARSVVLVVVGSLIATASAWLATLGWWWSVALVLISLALLWVLTAPTGRETPA
jgi:hypothetical protein